MVSLFFVVFAMLEFAFVLLIQRTRDGKSQIMGPCSRKKSAYKSRPKVSDVSMVKDNIGYQDNLKFSENEPTQQKQDATPMRKYLVWNEVGMSTESIDMMACVLFITCYVLYNLFYWM